MIQSPVTDGERQPLLSNPDVISLTAVRDDGALAQFLRAVSPIDTEQWSGMSMLKKIYNVYKVCCLRNKFHGWLVYWMMNVIKAGSYVWSPKKMTFS